MSHLAWESLELENVVGERDIWNTLLSLLSHHSLTLDKQEKMDGWMDIALSWAGYIEMF